MRNKKKNIAYEDERTSSFYLTEKEARSLSGTLLSIIDRKNELINSEKKEMTESMKKVTGGKGFILTNSKATL